MGLLANLDTAQIVEQIVGAKRHLAAQGDAAARITNVVFMGMGEPLNNLDAVLAAVDILVANGGLQFSKDKVRAASCISAWSVWCVSLTCGLGAQITVSTVGLVSEMRRFAAEGQAQLAVSLHATTDEVRDWIAPANRKHDLAALLAALEELYPADKGRANSGKHVLIECVEGGKSHNAAHKLLSRANPCHPPGTSC